MNKKVLVTGGTGYIGSHTVVELINAGYEVVIVDNLSNSERSVLDNIQSITGIKPIFYEFDVCDKDKLRQCVRENDIFAFMHFAASKAVGESVEKPFLYYRNNTMSLLNVVEIMSEYGIPNLVFSSSCTVYGQPNFLPVTEETPFKPAESPYGYTKQICEQILADGASAHSELKVIALRYFNPVGAHDSALIGELPSGIPNNLVPFITQTAIGMREELKVFGDDYGTKDGTPVRDFIHVVDLAKAHVAALRRLASEKQESNYEFFNVGTGKGYSVLEVIRTFEEVNNVTVNYKIADRREGDIEQIFADTKYANHKLDWKAEKELSEMLASAWKWQKAQGA